MPADQLRRLEALFTVGGPVGGHLGATDVNTAGGLRMRRTRSVSTLVALACVALAPALSGCTMAAGNGSEPDRQAEASPTPSSTAEIVAPIPGLAVSPGDELFTFEGNAVTEYGAQLQIELTLHQPVAWDSTAGALMIKYLDAQNVSTSITDAAWDAENNVSLGIVDISAVASGDPWRDGSAVKLDLGPFIAKDVVLGLSGHDDGGRFVLDSDGTGHAIVAYPAFDGSPDGSAWAEPSQTYGIRPFAGSVDSDLVPTLQGCSIEFTEAGLLNDWVASWSTPTADSCVAGIDG
jgi:hypothetical protein